MLRNLELSKRGRFLQTEWIAKSKDKYELIAIPWGFSAEDLQSKMRTETNLFHQLGWTTWFCIYSETDIEITQQKIWGARSTIDVPDGATFEGSRQYSFPVQYNLDVNQTIHLTIKPFSPSVYG